MNNLTLLGKWVGRRGRQGSGPPESPLLLVSHRKVIPKTWSITCKVIQRAAAQGLRSSLGRPVSAAPLGHDLARLAAVGPVGVLRAGEEGQHALALDLVGGALGRRNRQKHANIVCFYRVCPAAFPGTLIRRFRRFAPDGFRKRVRPRYR